MSGHEAAVVNDGSRMSNFRIQAIHVHVRKCGRTSQSEKMVSASGDGRDYAVRAPETSALSMLEKRK